MLLAVQWQENFLHPFEIGDLPLVPEDSLQCLNTVGYFDLAEE